MSSIALAVLLLFTALWTSGGLLQQQTVSLEKAKDVRLSPTEGVLSQSSHHEAISPEAIVTPPLRVNGSPAPLVLLPLPAFLLLILLSVPLLRHVNFPHYFFRFHRYVFGHSIAPNAP